MLKPAIFLDRDGVIIENRPDYVKTLDDFQFIPNAIEAIQLLHEKKAYIFIVTNQAAIGKGLMSLGDAQKINDYLKLKTGITDVFLCPHHPEDGCYCRKPRPGLFMQAFNSYKDIDREMCFMVGDTRSDLRAAEAVGISSILVRTGLGISEIVKYKMASDTIIKNDLMEASEYILNEWPNVRRTRTRAVTAK